MKATCPLCKRMTGFSRGVRAIGRESGVWLHFKCEHCDEELVVQTRDKDFNHIKPTITKG